MATETIKRQEQPAKSTPSQDIQTDQNDAATEKRRDVTAWSSAGAKTPPDIAANRRHKADELPDRLLKFDDFELIKTLGTGALSTHMSFYIYVGFRMANSYREGTFARVWLVRLKEPKMQEDRVYALKVLRKADSGLILRRLLAVSVH